MTRENLWERTLGGWFKLKDEVLKVTQLGREGISRSFLIHERYKLISNLGEYAFRWINENGSNDPTQERLVDQINKLNLRISSIDNKVTGITQDLSQKLDASHETDLKSERKKLSLRKKK